MRDTGRAAESAACDYLVRKGYRIKQRNYTIKGGEIDIIAEKDDFIVFVEVKAKTFGYDVASYGMPSSAVTQAKRTHIKKTAASYLRTHGRNGKCPRMDVIEILIHEHEDCVSLEINHYENAF